MIPSTGPQSGLRGTDARAMPAESAAAQRAIKQLAELSGPAGRTTGPLDEQFRLLERGESRSFQYRMSVNRFSAHRRDGRWSSRGKTEQPTGTSTVSAPNPRSTRSPGGCSPSTAGPPTRPCRAASTASGCRAARPGSARCPAHRNGRSTTRTSPRSRRPARQGSPPARTRSSAAGSRAPANTPNPTRPNTPARPAPPARRRSGHRRWPDQARRAAGSGGRPRRAPRSCWPSRALTLVPQSLPTAP